MAAPTYGLLVLWRVRAVNRGVAFVLLAGVAVTFLEEELTPRALGVTAAVGAAGIAVPQAVRLLRDPGASAAAPRLACGPSSPQRPGVARLRLVVGHPLLGAAGLLQLPCSMIVIYRALQGRREAVAAQGAGLGTPGISGSPPVRPGGVALGRAVGPEGGARAGALLVEWQADREPRRRARRGG